jgi:hypothetical protein
MLAMETGRARMKSHHAAMSEERARRRTAGLEVAGSGALSARVTAPHKRGEPHKSRQSGGDTNPD